MGRLFSKELRQALATAPAGDASATWVFYRWKVSRVLASIFHRHAFEAVSAHEILTTPITARPESTADLKMAAEVMQQLLAGGVGVARTQILRKCQCGRVKVETIAGSWTVEEIRGRALYARVDRRL